MSKKSLNLYNHNKEAYQKVKKAFQKEKIVGIVHATGTGKSYLAFQLALENKDKKTLYVVPSNSIIEHLKEILKEEGLDLEKDFPNLQFRTYQSFVDMSEKEIKEMQVDLLILDEFHHLGAPIWGARVNKIIETHENMKIFGMTAYTVRDRNTPYERDMAGDFNEELFSNKIVSRYDIIDAMIDGVLPKQLRYKSGYIHLENLETFLETKLQNSKLQKEEKILLEKLLKDAKKRIHESKSAEKLITKNICPDGKYIYFCPPNSEKNVNDIDTIRKETYEYLKKKYLNKKIIFYKTTSKEPVEGKKNREAFYNDKTLEREPADGCLRIMFAINQYNEGVHAPNVDGVILGRGTTSDIVFFEQLGRALSIKNKKKYEEYSKLDLEELRKIAREQEIENIEEKTKEELIEILLTPIVIDLAGNIEFIKELENNLKNRIKEIQTKGKNTKRKIKITNPSFDIEIENIEIFEILKYVRDRLMPPTWETMYELAESYYEHHGNLKVLQNFKTLNGYEWNYSGYNLGAWITNQRLAYQNKSIKKEERTNSYAPLTDEQVTKLEAIGMMWDVHEEKWNQMYELAESYYKHHGNLKVPQNFKTLNGYERNDSGYNLGKWIATQRFAYQNKTIKKEERKNSYAPLTDEQVTKLEAIGMVWSIRKSKGKLEKEELCTKYNLDYTKNEYLVKNLPYKELEAKINYLLENNLPLVDNNNNPNELFFMSEANMILKYGITKKELLKSKGKGR